MKDRAERDVRGSVLLTPAGASRAARHASLEKTCFCPGTKARFFVATVDNCDTVSHGFIRFQIQVKLCSKTKP